MKIRTPSAWFPIRDIFRMAYESLFDGVRFQSDVQRKTGAFGYNVSVCENCGHEETHASSCRNRNCPNCQAVQKELWVDKRGADVIDAPYFHVVFTQPHELNPLIY